MDIRGAVGLSHKYIKNQHYNRLSLKLFLALLGLFGCAMGGGESSPVTATQSIELRANGPENNEVKNSPDFQGGVPAPDGNWQPCMELGNCDQAKAESPSDDEKGAVPSNSEDLPEGFWDDVKNNPPPARPTGKIRPPIK